MHLKRSDEEKNTVNRKKYNKKKKKEKNRALSYIYINFSCCHVSRTTFDSIKCMFAP